MGAWYIMNFRCGSKTICGVKSGTIRNLLLLGMPKAFCCWFLRLKRGLTSGR